MEVKSSDCEHNLEGRNANSIIHGEGYRRCVGNIGQTDTLKKEGLNEIQIHDLQARGKVIYQQLSVVEPLSIVMFVLLRNVTIGFNMFQTFSGGSPKN